MALTAGLTAGQAAWAAFSIFFAGGLRGFSGFGFAVVAVPLGSLVVPPSIMVAATLLMGTTIGLRDCIAERHRADWAAVRRLVLGAAGGTPLGLLGLAFLPAAWVRLGLGGLVLMALAVTWRPLRHRARLGWGWGVLAGFGSGACNGLAAMSGPPVIVYFLATQSDRMVMRSSLLAYFPLASAMALPQAWWGGLLGLQALAIAGFGLPLMVVGGWIGTALFKRYGQTAYRPVALVALAVTALAALARGAAGLLP